MPAVRDRQVQEDWSDGMARDVAPALISKAGAYDIVNGLLDEDGNPYRRGGTAYKSSETFGGSGLTWAWDGFLLPGQRTVFANRADFGVLGDDDETPVNLDGDGLRFPKQSAVLEELLFIGGGSVYGGSRKSATYSTGAVKVTKGSKTVTGSGTSFEANVDIGMIFQIGNERVYVVSSVDSDTQLTLRDDYGGSSGEGKSYSLVPLYSISPADPYEKVDFLTSCANRIVFGSGRTVKFTEVNNPHTTKNSLGTTNEHKLPGGVWMVGLKTVGDTVLIFTTAGVWVLDGLALSIVDVNGNAQHRLQQLSSEVVLASASGMAGSEQRVVVPATDGIYLMDGISSPERISKPIDRLYRKRISDGHPLGGAVVYRGHYFLPILDVSGNVREMFVCRLDRPTRTRRQKGFPWSRFTGDGGEVAAFCVRASADPRRPLLLGAQARTPSRLLNCSPYFEPAEEFASDADGSAHVFELVSRDIATGNDTLNRVRLLSVRYELVPVEGVEDEPILKVFWSDGSLDDNEARWDEIEWDAFDWVADGAVFYKVSQEGPPSDGRDPEKFQINKAMRYGRFRLVTEEAAASFALRSIAMSMRPSGAVRR